MRIILPLLALASACGTDTGVPLEPAPTEPVYYGEVERIMRDNCVACHSSEPDRLAPMSLATYDDALAAAEESGIAYYVINRIMPPYYAKDDGTCQTFHDSKWLDDDELDALVAWSNGARLEGDPANSVAPLPAPTTLARVDRTLDIGENYGGGYLPDATVTDDYRCFVVDPIGSDKFLTGVHVRADNTTVVHHVIVFELTTAAAELDVEQRDLADDLPGYPCTGGPTDQGSSFVTGWAPGQGATPYPAGTGLPLGGARKLVVQIHYNLAERNGEPDRTEIDLELADAVESPAAIISVKGDVNLMKGQEDAIATGTRRLPTSVPSGRVWGGMIHMHQRGTGAEVTVERPQDACLLDLDGWSFHWQHMYWYDASFEVAGGETLRVTCHYDTTADMMDVGWGEGTDDEMCLAYLYVSR